MVIGKRGGSLEQERRFADPGSPPIRITDPVTAPPPGPGQIHRYRKLRGPRQQRQSPATAPLRRDPARLTRSPGAAPLWPVKALPPWYSSCRSPDSAQPLRTLVTAAGAVKEFFAILFTSAKRTEGTVLTVHFLTLSTFVCNNFRISLLPYNCEVF